MICFQKTYCNEHLYKPGEQLMAGHRPNKYFSETGMPETGPGHRPTVPGDDKRTSAQIRRDIEAMGAAPIMGGSRKELFYQWTALVKAKEDAAATAQGPELASIPAEPNLADLSKEDLIEFGQKAFGVALNPKAKKEELLEQLMDLQRRGG